MLKVEVSSCQRPQQSLDAANAAGCPETTGIAAFTWGLRKALRVETPSTAPRMLSS